MNKRKLDKILKDLASLRGKPNKPRTFEALAKKLGRELSNRGKEPNWVSIPFSDLRPLSIPHHGSKDLSPGVINTILNALEEDVFAWEERIIEEASKLVEGNE